jgi:Protein tyrosine/serine phosphatase
MTKLTGLDGTPNFRDLGRLPLEAGGTTKCGALYRAASLSSLTQDGVERLANSNLAVVVDMRTDDERNAAPDKLPTTREIKYVPIPIAPGSLTPSGFQKLLSGSTDLAKTLKKNLPTLGELYVLMLTQNAKDFVAAARCASQAPTLVHCTAGKDRTGVTCALILDAVGVKREAIVSDYAQSQEALSGAWAHSALGGLQAAGLPLIPELVQVATTSPRTAIEAALAWVYENFDDSADYLLKNGLAAEELMALKTSLAG